ncbi:anaphase-promoting complex subunit 2-like [Babylonia areolata]|uniref:anaphase-promoting complex subunit 2-like n=1 Tax=Babylonia areolata TaxID=304850 RepID=UPI003FD01D63
MAEIYGKMNESWSVIIDILSPEKQPAATRNASAAKRVELESALNVLDKCGVLHLVPAWFQQAMQDDIRRRVVKEFWKFFDPSEIQGMKADGSLPNQFTKAVNYLYDVMQGYFACLGVVKNVQHLLSLKNIADDGGGGERRGGRSRTDAAAMGCGSLDAYLVLLLKSFLFSTFPQNFKEAVQLFYARVFAFFRREEVHAPVHEYFTNEQLMELFNTINLKLHKMGLLEHVAGAAITSVVTDHIRTYIQTTCKGDFETPYLEHLEIYLDTKVLEWLRLIYQHSEEKAQSIDSFRGRLMHFIWETHANVLIEQLFNIVIEFPDSEPALKDLRQCLEKTDLRSTLVSSLRRSIEVRLLHPGVNTNHILTAYISAIRALRALDPAGVILELVCEPVRKYLRSREDTVRCIVAGLTDTESNELVDELLRGAPQHVDERIDSEDETDNWESWQPDPVDANPETASKRRKEQDIISTLVNVYGSQELFVTEYRTLLADRLLSPTGAAMAAGVKLDMANSLERELRYLELLKLRFGENPLHGCQVMLKDVADSRRINSRITESKQHNREGGSDTQDVDVSAIILSAQFWPSFREEKITLPPELQSSLDAYTQQYEMLKGNRTLVWKPHLGVMNIELELKEQKLNFSVTPVQAALIMQFQEQKRWTVEDLGQALEMAPSAVRRKLAFWQGQGVVREEGADVFLLVEDRRGGPGGGGPHPEGTVITAHTEDEEELESAMASAAQQREQEMQMFWTYITGMLQNLDCLPLERIHSMLRMFAVQGPESGEFTQQQLKAFLDHKVREQKLVFASGVYRLPKN